MSSLPNQHQQDKLVKLLTNLLVDTKNMDEEKYTSSLSDIVEYVGNDKENVILLGEFASKIIEQHPESSEIIISSFLFIIHSLYSQARDEMFDSEKLGFSSFCNPHSFKPKVH